MTINPILLHLWGPLSIHAYGVCIAIGIIIALWLLRKDTKIQRLITTTDLATALQLMVVSGYLGGRILCLISEDTQSQDFWLLFKFWEPGLSILGCIIGIALTLFTFLWYKKIPVLAFTDRISIYSPLVQSFGRLGCFFAGCCYGQHTQAWWSIIYNHPEHMAPLGIALHPTQLYSAAILLCIFLFLYWFLQQRVQISGILTCSYLMLVSIERFVVDFLRWDRTWWQSSGPWSYFSTNQWFAIGIFSTALCSIIILKSSKKKSYGSI